MVSSVFQLNQQQDVKHREASLDSSSYAMSNEHRSVVCVMIVERFPRETVGGGGRRCFVCN